MKRSELNNAVLRAKAHFEKNGWAIPPDPQWDVTDFGLGEFEKSGLVLLNLADEPEYCEKLMFAKKNQITPAHYHRKKKEDIIVRKGILQIQFWKKDTKAPSLNSEVKVKINGKLKEVKSGDILKLNSGERVTIHPGILHEFFCLSDECIIGEVSTANDDENDNFFLNPDIGRFPEIIEDEPILFHLMKDEKK
jgi:D-lyxose ketol-isomerase